MGNYFGLIEIGLTAGAVLAFCWWELRSLRKLREQREREKAASGTKSGPSPTGR